MPVLAHPVERLRRRPVAAQPDLHEVATLDRAGLDQPAHRRAVAGEDAPVVLGRVGVGVEVDDADACRAGGPRRRRSPIGQVIEWSPPRMIGTRPLGHLEDLAEDHRVAALESRPGRCWRRRRRRRRGPRTARRRAAASRSRRGCSCACADRPRPEPRAGSVADRVVERRADDGDVDARATQLVRIGDPGQLHEGRRADVGRQVEVVEASNCLVPAVVRREVPLEVGSVGRSATVSSGDGRRTGRGTSSRQAPPVRIGRPAGRPRIVAPSRAGELAGHSCVVGCACSLTHLGCARSRARLRLRLASRPAGFSV